MAQRHHKIKYSLMQDHHWKKCQEKRNPPLLACLKEVREEKIKVFLANLITLMYFWP